MSVLGKLRNFVWGPADTQYIVNDLTSLSVPVSNADCRNCADPCDQEHSDYSKRMHVDMDSDMYGSVKPYRRQVIISTGKYDWDSEITDTKGTLAAHLLHVNDTLGAVKKGPKQNGRKSRGIFEQSDAQRLSILNGSHNTICDDSTKETVIVFPDFKIVAQIPRSQEGAEHFWDDSLDPSYGRAGVPQEKSELKSWVLPYSCVIMLCSHKRRDKRCHITAPILAETFTQYLEKEGWEVHNQLEDVSHTTPLETTEAGKSQEEKEESFIAHLKTLPEEHKVLIVRTSHFGGHKFAGNCVIHTPSGSSIWYGRVTPHEVESIVKNTIINGKVLPTILRGGLNLSRPGCSSVYDW